MKKKKIAKKLKKMRQDMQQVLDSIRKTESTRILIDEVTSGISGASSLQSGAKVGENRLELQREYIDSLNALVAEWKELWKFHAHISRMMTGMPGGDLVGYAGSCYMDCAKKLEIELRNWKI